ncbi:MAG: hypothetical protein BGO29_01985 [Bacteroidales bacterium 36-12]|nr:MAG: hypothetical protein BGO29_01985 [Bacteroidales bacterium 36-12]
MTSLCPDKCGSSGDMAKFKVLKYIDFVVNGQSGTEKLENYQVLISDYYKNELEMPYVPIIKNLKEGDEVTIHVEYVYDTTQDTVMPVENLISIIKK